MISFKEMTTEEPSTLMVVDSLNMAFSFRGKNDFADKYISMVQSLRKSYKAAKVIMACDMGSSSYRKAIYPEYKANRTEKYANQTEAEALAFEQFFVEFNRALSLITEFPILKYDKCEADDIAAYVVRKYQKKYKIWLMSSDKDWDLLIGPHVSRFSYVTRKEVTLDNWSDHYDYDPDDHISIKCLTGDSGDNIPGVPGIGPVKARALVQEYGTTYDIIASLPISSRYKYIANLNEFGASNLLLNYKLMDLVTHCAEALGSDNCNDIDKKLEEYL